MQILSGIILLGILIVFHEFGHFLFAKMLGVRVLVFSVGFGPKIWGFKIGETEYRLSAIPLGGYIRMFGESLDEELTPEEKRASFMHQKIWRKSLIAFAGPLFNFILPVILFFFLLIGTEQFFAPKIGTILPDSPAQAQGLQVGDQITAIDGKPVESFSEAAQIISNSPNQEINFTVQRENTSEAINIPITPKGVPSSNPLEKGKLLGRIGVMPAVERPKIILANDHPLLLTGVKNFDEIIEIDGRRINDAAELEAALKTISKGSKLTIKRYDSKNIAETIQKEILFSSESVSFSNNIQASKIVLKNILQAEIASDLEPIVAKTKKQLTSAQNNFVLQKGIARAKGSVVSVTPGSIAENIGLKEFDRVIAFDGEAVASSALVQQKLLGETQKSHVLGVLNPQNEARVVVFDLPKDAENSLQLNSSLESFFGTKLASVFEAGEIKERRVGSVEALTRSVSQSIDIFVLTAKSVWMLVSMELPAKQIGGPIMVFDVAHQAASKGLPYYIYIMCLLSINLGLLNLLPIPALDGGHLLLFGIEAVQRRPLTTKTRTIATQIGVAMLLSLMFFAIFNDISRLLG